MQNVYTVRQVNAYIKSMFTQDVVLRSIYMKGEVSNCKYHTSGHIYFSLKDESGTISCVMFASARKGLAFGMKNGQQVLVLALKSFEGVYDVKTVHTWLRTFYRRFFAQQFKRSCLPDGPKVGSVTLSPRGDWRMPSDASSRLWLAQIDALNPID